MNVYSTLREVAGQRRISLNLKEESTVNDVVNLLEERFGIQFRQETGEALRDTLEERFNVFLNGKILKLPDNYDTRLKGGDEIVIVMPVGGGLNSKAETAASRPS